MIRLSIDAALAGRVFERFVVDIATGVAAPAVFETVEIGAAFDFAGIATVEMAVIDLRTHWAEKFSAYLRRFDDRPNTRVKDLVDLVLLIEHGLVADGQLFRAVETTFERRGQVVPDDDLPSMAEAWEVPYAAMAEDVGLLAATSAEAHSLVERTWRQCRWAGGA